MQRDKQKRLSPTLNIVNLSRKTPSFIKNASARYDNKFSNLLMYDRAGRVFAIVALLQCLSILLGENCDDLCTMLELNLITII